MSPKAKIPTVDDLLTEWHEAKRNADYWTVEEKRLRCAIFAMAFPEPVKGTNQLRIGHGMGLLGDYRMNYKIDQAALEAASLPIDLKDRVINYRPEVRQGEWNALISEERLHFGEIITETPGTPGLTLKPQNKIRWKR